jgi:hypothetical protein
MAQWHFYSEMINQDRKLELDREIAMTEYLASFWNPEAVKKAKEMRDAASQHSFKSDEEFEESIVTGDYKDNPLLDAVKKIRELEKSQRGGRNISPKSSPKSKLPTNLSSINSTLEKFK